MHIKHLTVDLVRGVNAKAVPTPQQQDHLEVRLLAAYVTIEFLKSLVGPITYILQLAPSLIYQAAARSGHSEVIAGMFVVAGLLMLPHAFALLFLPRTLEVRWPRKCAALSAALVGFVWAYLAVLTLPLQIKPLFWLYVREAVTAIGLAFIYSISLNAQLLRRIYKLLNPHEA
jgi:hypothetical protein